MQKPENPPKLEDYGFEISEYDVLKKELDDEGHIPIIIYFIGCIGFWFIIFIYGGLISIFFVPVLLVVFFIYKKGTSKYNKTQINEFKQFLDEEEKYNKKIIEYENWIKKQKEEFWFNLSGHEFEVEVNTLLQKMGFNTQLTKGSGDKGIDIVILEDDGGTIVQCKNHKNPVSPAIIRELYGVMASEYSKKGILINTGGFTKGVYEFSVGKPIELWDIEKIIKLNETL